MGKLKKWPPETFFDLTLALSGMIIIITSLAYGLGTFRKPGPGLYPFFIGLSISAFSMVLLIAEWRAKTTLPSLFAEKTSGHFYS